MTELVTSTCARCTARGAGDTEHELLEEIDGGVRRVRCGCGNIHRDKLLGPQPGPQTDFLALTWVFILLYGGAAYGGKSYALLLDALSHATTPGWVGVIFRRHSKDLTGGGTIFDKAKKLFKGTGAVPREGQYVDFTWPSGAVLMFKHLDGANVDDYQGQEFAWVGIDEATHLDLSWILYLATRLRTDCGSAPVMRMTCNPDKRHALLEWVRYMLDAKGYADRSQSGRVRYFARPKGAPGIVWGDSPAEVAELTGRPESWVKSFAFIPSLLTDNPIGTRLNPDYESNLATSSDEDEEALLGGCWYADPVRRGLLKGILTSVVAEPLAPIIARARFVDMAHTLPSDVTPNPDYTAGALMLRDVEDNVYLAGLVVCRQEGGDVLKIMRATATLDGPHVAQGFWVDPSAGKSWAAYVGEQLQKSPRCGPVTSYPCGNKLGQKIIHATPVHEHLRQGKVFILAGSWLEAVYQEGASPPRTMLELIADHLGSFPSEKKTDKDDIVDAVSGAFRLVMDARVVVGNPRETIAKAQEIAAANGRGGLRERGRRGYGARR